MAATLAVLPLALDPRGSGSFRTVKAFLAGFCILASAGCLALAGRLRWEPALGRPLLLALGPLVAGSFLALPFSVDPGRSVPAFLSLAIGALALLAWPAAWSRHRLGTLLLWTLPGALVTSTIALLQLLHVFPWFQIAERAGVGNRYDVIGLAGNPGDLGQSLVLPLLVAQAAYLRDRSRVWLGAMALLLAGMIASGTLAAVLAWLVGGLLLGGLGPGFSASGKRWWVLILVAALLGIPTARERLAGKLQELVRGDWDAFLSGRPDAWKVALELVRERPWLGVGPGNFGREFVETKARLLERGVSFYPDQFFAVYENAHSDPLELVAELGLPGLLALVGIALGARSLFRERWAAWTPIDRGLAAGGGAAFLLLAGTGFPFRIAVVAFPALVFFSWLASLPEPAPKAVVGRGSWRQRGLGGLLLVAALLLAGKGVRRIEAIRQLREVERQSELMSTLERADRRLLLHHLAVLERVERELPRNVSVVLARANQQFLLGSFERALEIYEQAQRIERRPETHYNLAVVLERLGCHAAARREREWAAALDPAIARKLGLDPRKLAGPPPTIFASDFECRLRGWLGPFEESNEARETLDAGSHRRE